MNGQHGIDHRAHAVDAGELEPRAEVLHRGGRVPELRERAGEVQVGYAGGEGLPVLRHGFLLQPLDDEQVRGTRAA